MFLLLYFLWENDVVVVYMYTGSGFDFLMWKWTIIVEEVSILEILLLKPRIDRALRIKFVIFSDQIEGSII